MIGLTQTSYVNAWSLFYGCKLLGIKFFTTDYHQYTAIPFKSKANEGDWLLFTEEKTLKFYLKKNNKNFFFKPSSFDSNLLDDKFKFAEWVEKGKFNLDIPKQWSIDSFKIEKSPFLVKAKHSWLGNRNLPRGWVCYSPSDLACALKKIKDLGLREENFFIQEWLGGQEIKMISVCGFHDHANAKRNLTAIVQRIGSHSQGLSGSCVVQTTSDFDELLIKSQNLLDKLLFTGPYELEFIITKEKIMVLELNPRFWMQHGIFIINGNGLLKRYFEFDTHEDYKINKVSNTVWIDGMYFSESLLSLNFHFVLFCIKKIFFEKKRVFIAPSISLSLFFVARNSLRKKYKKIMKKFLRYNKFL